jgi:hypothetical protein
MTKGWPAFKSNNVLLFYRRFTAGKSLSASPDSDLFLKSLRLFYKREHPYDLVPPHPSVNCFLWE